MGRSERNWPGYFLYKDSLLIFNEPLFFDEETGQWFLWLGPHNQEGKEQDNTGTDGGTDEKVGASDGTDTDDCLAVDAAGEFCIEEFHRCVPDRDCRRAVFFYQRKRTEKRYGPEAVDRMKQLDGCTLYEKGELGNTIQAYIERN